MLRVRTALTGWDGGPGLMTHYFLMPLQNDAAALRVTARVRAVLASTLPFFFPDGVTLQVSGDVDVLDPGTGLITNTLSVAAPLPVPASGGTSHAPPEVAMLVSLKTSTFLAGRRVRGRQFISPLVKQLIADDGLATFAAVTGLAAYGDQMRTGGDPGDSWVVWHRPKLGVGGTAAIITATSVSAKFAVLRSRRD